MWTRTRSAEQSFESIRALALPRWLMLGELLPRESGSKLSRGWEHCMVLDQQVLQRIAADFRWHGSSEEPLVAGYERLRTEVAAFHSGASSLEVLELQAVRTAHAVLESEPFWSTFGAVYQNWSWDDGAFADLALARNPQEFVEAEAEILRQNGLSQTASVALAIKAAEMPATNNALVDPEVARRQTAVLAEELEQKQMREEAAEREKDRKFVGKLRRVGRVLHLAGGGVLMLADVGGVVATSIAAPLATIGTGTVAIVSIKTGSDLIRTGVDEKFGRQ